MSWSQPTRILTNFGDSFVSKQVSRIGRLRKCCPIEQRQPNSRRCVQYRRQQSSVVLATQQPNSSSSQDPGDRSNESSTSTGSSIPDALPAFDSTMDWREFRARMVAQSRKSTPASADWAHSVPQPETGCLLLAHPLLFTESQQYFRYAVILILSHDNLQGSWGVILNRPTEYRVKEVETLNVLQPEFSDCRLYLGGDCGDTQLHLVHGCSGLEGANPVVQGVYSGGFPTARKAIADGLLDPENVRLFINYAGWGAGQLENECRKGVWFVAAASPSIILSQVQGSDCTKEMWHKVADLMGGDHALVSAKVRESEENARLERQGLSGLREDNPPAPGTSSE